MLGISEEDELDWLNTDAFVPITLFWKKGPMAMVPELRMKGFPMENPIREAILMTR